MYFILQASYKKTMIQTNVFKISNMHCSSCAMNIDGELEDSQGVIEANTSFAKQEVEVKFDPEKISQEKIRDVIKSAGYEAQVI